MIHALEKVEGIERNPSTPIFVYESEEKRLHHFHIVDVFRTNYVDFPKFTS